VEPLRGPPEPLVTGGPSSEHPLSPNVVNQDRETTPLYLDSTSGEPRVAYVAPDELTAQCTKYGHVQKAKYGTLSESTIVPPFSSRKIDRPASGILAAAFFFPWGLLCLIGSRVVYCERCGLILRAPGCRDCGSRPTYYSGKRRAHC